MDEGYGSKTFGIVSFILSLLGIGVFITSSYSTIIRVCAVIIFIFGIVFAILQRKRIKTGLSLVGLIISIIGLIIAVAFIGVSSFLFDSAQDDFKEQVESGTSCFDAIVSVSINDACVDGSNINVGMTLGSKASEKAIFLIDGQKTSEYDLAENMVIPGTGNEISVAPIAGSKECESTRPIEVLSSC